MPSPVCEDNRPVPGQIEFAAPQSSPTGSDKGCVTNHVDTSSPQSSPTGSDKGCVTNHVDTSSPQSSPTGSDKGCVTNHVDTSSPQSSPTGSDKGCVTNHVDTSSPQSSLTGSDKGCVTNHVDTSSPQSSLTGSDKGCVTNHVDTSSVSCKTTDDAPALAAAPPPWPSNKTGYRGVRQRRNNKWAAEAYDPKKKSTVVLGIFDSPVAAAAAYDTAAVNLRGSRAKLNFPSAEHQAVKKQRRRRAKHTGVVPWPGGKWGAQIYVKKENFIAKLFLGIFDSPEAADRAYYKAAIDFRGSRARLILPAENHAANNLIATSSDLTTDRLAERKSAASHPISTVQAVSRKMEPTNRRSSPKPSDGYLYLDEIESTPTP